MEYLLLRDVLCLSRPPVRTEHTPNDLTHTLLVLLITGCSTAPRRWAAFATPRAVSAHGRTPNQHHFCDGLLLLQHLSRLQRLTQSLPLFQSLSPLQSLSLFHRLNQYPLTIASSLALSARVSLQVSSRQSNFARRPQHSKSTDHGNNAMPALLLRPRLVL